MRRSLLLLAALALPTLHAAELGEQDISVAYDYAEIDTRKDEHHFRGNVRISQGPMFIESDQATALGAFQNEDSRWTFEHNVHVQTADAELRANSATAKVVDGAITDAVVKGSPAEFEQRNAVVEKLVRGRAGQIEYDVLRGIVRLENDVWFTYGDNEFRGAVVVYNVRDERVVVNPEGKNQGRVNMTIRPRPGIKPNSGSDSPRPPDSGSGP